jgi:hypothetical protein
MPKKKAKPMARRRGGKNVPQAGGVAQLNGIDWQVADANLSCTVGFSVDGDQSCTLQFWECKNPGNWGLALSIADVGYDGVVSGDWGDGVTGQAYCRLVDAKGELLYQTDTIAVTGAD